MAYYIQLDLGLVKVEAIKKTQFIVAVNSVGGIIVPKLLKALGVCEIIEIKCVANSNSFHNPESISENLLGTAAIML